MGATEDLLAAAEAGDIKAAKAAIKAEANINAYGVPLLATWCKDPIKDGGPTALMLAMRGGYDEVALELLNKGADFTLIDFFGKNAAMLALEYGHTKLKALEGIISKMKPADFSHIDKWGHNLMLYAALAGAPNIVDNILSVDTGCKSLEAKVEVGDFKDLDLLSVSAKHGKGAVIGSLFAARSGQSVASRVLAQSREVSQAGAKPLTAGVSEDKLARMPKGEKGISAAVILACTSGYWMDELMDQLAHELDEPDANGTTPVMHALIHGQAAVAQKLITKGVDCDEWVPPSEEVGPTKTMLHVAVAKVVQREQNARSEGARTEATETITALVRAGAIVALPSLHEERLSTSAIREKMGDPAHAIGYCLAMAASEVDSHMVKFKFAAARMMLAAAFRETPGAALCAFVEVATKMTDLADVIRLSNLELSDELIQESVEIGATVGEFIKTLPEIQRERLLRSVPGDNFLRAAADQGMQKMLFAAPVTAHVGQRWLGELMYLASEKAGVYQWGGFLKISDMHHYGLLVLVPVCWIVNMALLPFVAVLPWLPDYLRIVLDSFGEVGVDPRDSPQNPGGKKGYSPTMALWWRSLLLVDVPCFKYAMAQIGTVGMLGALLYMAPCFDFDNHQKCFIRDTEHMVGDADDTLDHLVEATTGYSLDSIVPATTMPAGAVGGAVGPALAEGVRRLLKGGKGARAAAGGSSGGGIISGGVKVAHIPNLFGLGKDAVWVLLSVYAGSMFFASLNFFGSSISTPYTALSIVGSALSVTYLALDLVPFYDFDEAYDPQPMALSLATFLLWTDVVRALLLKTFTCGPSVLMVILMFKDVGIFLILTVGVAVGFALCLYFNDILQKGAESAASGDCPFVQNDFISYGRVLVEEMIGLGGVGDQISCTRAEGDFISTYVLELYLVVAVVLMLNMLIAMMGETFGVVRANQEQEYAYINAQIVIYADLDASNTPPPLLLLRGPAKLLTSAYRLVTTLLGMGGAYKTLPEPSGEGGSAEPKAPTRKPDYADFSVVDGPEMVDIMKEADMESDKADLAGLILSVKEQVDKTNDKVEALEAKVLRTEAAAAAADGETDVQIYDGYFERASRLTFHYADKFADTKPVIEKRTYLPSGVSENEPEKLPVSLDDETEKTEEESLKKLRSRGLFSYPFAQQVPMKAGEEIIAQLGGVESYVYRRANGEYGLSQIWPTKINDSFQKSFKLITESNPDPSIFQPQAVYEFERTIKMLFGQDATKKAPILFCKNERANTLPIYKGTAEALQAFLRANPKVVKQLKIAKLFPGGFVTTMSVGGNPKKNEPPKKDSFKTFDLTPGEDYFLYTKQGYESMACVKSAAQFEAECTLGRLLHIEDLFAEPDSPFSA